MEPKDSKVSLSYNVGEQEYTVNLGPLTAVEFVDRRLVQEMIEKMFLRIKEFGFYG